MKSSLPVVIAVCATACVLPVASAAVLTFDDLPGNGPTFFTQNYNGFSFGTNDPATTEWAYTAQTAPTIRPHSGTKYAGVNVNDYPADGAYRPTQPIANATPFIFRGAWFSDTPTFAVPDRIAYQLYVGATLVATSPLSAALSAVPSFVASGYAGLVDSVVIVGQQGYYGMDDFTYDLAPPPPPVTAVPEPGSLALLVAGLGALASAMHRRGRAARSSIGSHRAALAGKPDIGGPDHPARG